jgi:hypothetical protein
MIMIDHETQPHIAGGTPYERHTGLAIAILKAELST